MSDEEIIREVDKDEPFYRNSGGGVTFSGGEAMIYPERVKKIAEDYKKRGISTVIETCGYVPWENFEQVIDYIDIFLFDIKMIDDQKHVKYCGGSNQIILSNVVKLDKRADVIIRMPIIPGINDSERDIRMAAEWITENLSNNKRIHLLAYHNLGRNKYDALGRKYLLDGIDPPDDSRMEEIKSKFEAHNFEVTIGG